MRTPHLPFAEFAPLPVSEVRALHNLAMGISRHIAEARGSTIWSDRVMRKHRYVFFADQGSWVGDDTADQYLGVRVVKRAPREWRMAISFLGNNMETAYADSNIRELNSFIWNDEQAFGLRRTREAIGRTLISKQIEVDGYTPFVGGVDVGTHRESFEGLTLAACDHIANRMLETVSSPRVKAFIPKPAA